MKLWHLALLSGILLVISGLLICDNQHKRVALKECRKAKLMEPDTVYIVKHYPRDTQPTERVSVQPKHPRRIDTIREKDTVYINEPSYLDTEVASADTNCIVDTTIYPDGMKFIHSICSPDIPLSIREPDIRTIRERPPDTVKEIKQPVIIEKTPWYNHWYIKIPAALAAGYGLFEAGKHWK